MNIVFLTTGDVEKIATSKRAFGLAEPLEALGHKVTIIVVDTENNRRRINFEGLDAAAQYVRAASALQELLQKYKVIWRLKPDLVYLTSFGFRNCVFPNLTPQRTNCCVEHSELLSSIENRSLTQRMVDRFFEFLVVRAFDFHICASKYLEVLYRLKGMSSSSVVYLPYGYKADLIKPKKKKGGPTNFLFMGTITKNYGAFLMLDAVAKLRDEVGSESFTLNIYGSGRDAQRMSHEIQENGLSEMVRLHGFVAEDLLYSALSEADAFISPLYETVQDLARCPSKLFMYLPYQKPVLTSPIGEAKNLFSSDYPFFFRAGSSDALAAKMRLVVQQRGQEYSHNEFCDVDSHSWSARAITFHRALS